MRKECTEAISMCFTSIPYAATIKSLFDGNMLFSEDGSNMKAKMATHIFFADYWEDCAGLYYALCMHNTVRFYELIAVNMHWNQS